MKIRSATRGGERAELQMTPMIDIVFQLLVFFVLTFKIVAAEGDFNIKMPQVVGVQNTPLPPLHVRLEAGAGGQLSGISLDNRPVAGFDQLRLEVMQIMQPAGQPSLMAEAEVELHCDSELDYRHVIDAITSVTGYIENGQAHHLSTKVRFAPPGR